MFVLSDPAPGPRYISYETHHIKFIVAELSLDRGQWVMHFRPEARYVTQAATKELKAFVAPHLEQLNLLHNITSRMLK